MGEGTFRVSRIPDGLRVDVWEGNGEHIGIYEGRKQGIAGVVKWLLRGNFVRRVLP